VRDEQIGASTTEAPPAAAAPASSEGGSTRPFAERYDQAWLGSALRPLLIVVLVSCINVVFVAIINRFAPELHSTFTGGLLLLAILAAVVGSLSTTVLAQPALRLSRTAALRLAELGLFLIATRLLVWATATGFPDGRQIVREPVTTLIDPLFLASAVVVGFAWLTASEVTEDLNQLGLGSDELYVAERRSDRSGDPMRSSGIDRRAVLTSFAIRWVTLGLLLIVLATGLRQEMRFDGFLSIARQNIEPAAMTALLVYFLAGLLLLSHGQLALLRARWTLDRMPSDESVTRRWPPLVMALIAGAALLALLLPFGGTFLLATILSTVLTTLFVVLMTLYRLLLFGFLWLLSLFGVAPPPPPPDSVQATQPVAPEAAPIAFAQMPPWLGAGLFWGVLLLICLYALMVYLGDRDVRLGWLTWLIRTLRRRWDEWRILLRRTQRRFNRAGTREGQSESTHSLSRWSLLLRGDPDHQVRTLYLTALQNAAEAGIARESAETPLHFAPRLEDSLAGEADSLDAVRSLTDAFVEVRYGGRHASADRARTLHEKWQALRRALRRYKNPAPQAGADEQAPPTPL
jgi:hypothetical protein